MEFLYSGRKMNVNEALKIGFVNEIVDSGESGRHRLIKKIKTEIATYKMVWNNFLILFLSCVLSKK